MDNPTLPPEQNEPSVVKFSDLEFAIGKDVNTLVCVTMDLTTHASAHPSLLARDYQVIADTVKQLGRVLDRISVKEAAE